jgi:hypothetical protein
MGHDRQVADFRRQRMPIAALCLLAGAVAASPRGPIGFATRAPDSIVPVH